MSKMSPRLKQANKQEKTKQKKKSIKGHNKVNQADFVTISSYFARFNFINDTVFVKRTTTTTIVIIIIIIINDIINNNKRTIIIINAKRTIIKQQQQNA